jgi:hypothetical protein
MRLLGLPTPLCGIVCSFVSCHDLASVARVHSLLKQIIGDRDLVNANLWPSMLHLLYGVGHTGVGCNWIQAAHLVLRPWHGQWNPPELKRALAAKGAPKSSFRAALHSAELEPLRRRLKLMYHLLDWEHKNAATVLAALTTTQAAAYGALLMERCAWQPKHASALYRMARACFSKAALQDHEVEDKSRVNSTVASAQWWCKFWLAESCSLDVKQQWDALEPLLSDLHAKATRRENMLSKVTATTETCMARHWFANVHRLREPGLALCMLKQLVMQFGCVQSCAVLSREAPIWTWYLAAPWDSSKLDGWDHPSLLYPPILQHVGLFVSPSEHHSVAVTHRGHEAFSRGLVGALSAIYFRGGSSHLVPDRMISCIRGLAKNLENALAFADELNHSVIMTNYRRILEISAEQHGSAESAAAARNLRDMAANTMAANTNMPLGQAQADITKWTALLRVLDARAIVHNRWVTRVRQDDDDHRELDRTKFDVRPDVETLVRLCDRLHLSAITKQQQGQFEDCAEESRAV